jgi:hypothetical protein
MKIQRFILIADSLYSRCALDSANIAFMMGEHACDSGDIRTPKVGMQQVLTRASQNLDDLGGMPSHLILSSTSSSNFSISLDLYADR